MSIRLDGGDRTTQALLKATSLLLHEPIGRVMNLIIGRILADIALVLAGEFKAGEKMYMKIMTSTDEQGLRDAGAVLLAKLREHTPPLTKHKDDTLSFLAKMDKAALLDTCIGIAKEMRDEHKRQKK